MTYPRDDRDRDDLDRVDPFSLLIGEADEDGWEREGDDEDWQDTPDQEREHGGVVGMLERAVGLDPRRDPRRDRSARDRDRDRGRERDR